MSTVTFDTLKFANRLKAAGADSRIAEAEAEALAEALEINFKDLATKQDIVLLEQRMTIKLGALMVVAVTAVATLVKLL